MLNYPPKHYRLPKEPEAEFGFTKKEKTDALEIFGVYADERLRSGC